MPTIDRYTKAVLTIIAIALLVIATKPVREAFGITFIALRPEQAEAQTSAGCPAVSALQIDRTWKLLATPVGVGGGWAIFEGKDGVLWAVNISQLLEKHKAGGRNCVFTRIERN